MGRSKAGGLMWCEAVGGFCDGEVFQTFRGVKYFSSCRLVWIIERDGVDGASWEEEKIQRWDFVLSDRVRHDPKKGKVHIFEYVGSELLDFDDLEEDGELIDDFAKGEEDIE